MAKGKRYGPARKIWLSRRFDELREGSQLDRIGAHSFSFPLDSLSLDFAEDREPEVWEDEDDLEL